jgi:hypothetical protein
MELHQQQLLVVDQQPLDPMAKIQTYHRRRIHSIRTTIEHDITSVDEIGIMPHNRAIDIVGVD